ncbi:MAG: hypothetical protein QOJ69_793 [Actinomycetota bacterium]|nr:hypothetical protein [Actinomycetota bacterium]
MSLLRRLVASQLGADRAGWLLDGLDVHPALLEPGPEDDASRAVVAQALGILLLDDILYRVPTATAYMDDRVGGGSRVHLDHGAVRTVAGVGCGGLPEGQESVTRLLSPLGYRQRETHDLGRLRMTGRSWCHQDLPGDIPQYFVSELHADRFSEPFRAATRRVLSSSRDPLTENGKGALAHLAAHGMLPRQRAESLLGELVPCFGRQHGVPSLADYEALLAESDEMAWIATEGTAFNHASDRVADVVAVAGAERAAGRPIKDGVEVSASGRVLQTAHRAAVVDRTFKAEDGSLVTRSVPGSFFELISRHPLPDGSGIDLGFDAANAQEIFTMTRPATP